MADHEVWRAALKDSAHERHKAAWAFFGGELEGSALAKLLDGQREAVTAWALELLQDEALALSGSFGDGFAPINAARLLGEWKVVDAFPHLLKIVLDKDEDEDPSMLWDAAVSALSNMPPEMLPAFLETAQSVSEDQQVMLMSIMADVCGGKADDELFNWMCAVFERKHPDWELEFLVEQILHANPERGIPYVEAFIAKRRLSPRTLEIFKRRIQETRDEMDKKS
jgi:hypothetical protein